MGQMALVRRKLRETLFFFLRLSGENALFSQGEEDAEFYTSAFLSAGRSVVGFFDGKQNVYYRQWYRDWKIGLPEPDRKLLNDMVCQRNLVVHEGGADIIPEFELVPQGKDSANLSYENSSTGCLSENSTTPLRRKKYYFWIDGKRLDAVPTCERYLELLLKLVTDFEESLSV